MQTEGLIAPDTPGAAREQYAALAPAAETVVRETARAMAFDRIELDERVTADVVATAHDALFASLLEVHVGTREEFEEWCAGRDLRREVAGSEHVDATAWHRVPFEGRVVATTFQDERDAAVATLRRQVFGRHYRPVVADGGAGNGDGEANGARTGGTDDGVDAAAGADDADDAGDRAGADDASGTDGGSRPGGA